jgi:hypothetical protein
MRVFCFSFFYYFFNVLFSFSFFFFTDENMEDPAVTEEPRPEVQGILGGQGVCLPEGT